MGFLLSPVIDWCIPVQRSTHQELVWDQYEHWCECGHSEESSDSAAGNSRQKSQAHCYVHKLYYFYFFFYFLVI